MMSLLFAAVTGNMSQLYRYHADNIDFNWSDYDGRTALHLAVCGGNTHFRKINIWTCYLNIRIRRKLVVLYY